MIGTLIASLALLHSPTSKYFRSLPRGDMKEVFPGFVKVKLTPERAALIKSSAVRGGSMEIVPDGRFVSQIGNTGWTVWSVPKDTNVESLRQSLKKQGLAQTVEPLNRVYALWTEPNDPDFRAIETSEEYILIFDEGTGEFRRDWHLEETYAEEGWSISPNTWYTGFNKPANTPTIAVVDTGCDMAHPDFINTGGTGPDVAQGGQWKMSLSKQFHLGELDPFGTPEDANGHGTHVAGLALASGNNGQFGGLGTIGTGYNCNGMMLRIFDDQGVADDASAAAAIFYAADNGADVINLSIGTENYSQLFQDAVTYAFQKGCVVVAAGNEDGNGGGDIGPIYPAACVSSLAVSANGPYQTPATGSYSGSGYYVDIAAPGGDVLTDPLFSYFVIQFVYSTAMRQPGALSQNQQLYPPYHQNYTYLAGTSMASPQVAGAAGLYLGQRGYDLNDGWNNLRTFRAIEESAEGVMGAPFGGREDNQGYGSLDLENLALGGTRGNVQVGGIKGMVYSGATPVANTQVRATKVGGGTLYSTTTHPDGSYRFESLPPGNYNVTALAFSVIKTQKVMVKLGSDNPGQDFWINGNPFDTTAPTIIRVEVPTVNASSITVRHWGYDTETGLASIQFRIGTTSGGNEVLADQDILPDGPTVTLSGLSLSQGTTYYLRARYTNGNGATSDRIVPFSFGQAGAPVAPSNYSLFRGVLVSGNLPSLFNSDDNRLVVRASITLNSTESPVTIVVSGTSPFPTATAFQFKIEAQAQSTGVQQKIELFDYVANTYVLVDTRNATSNLDSVASVTPSNPSRFIKSSTRDIQARILFKPNGPMITSPMEGRLDWVQWTITP